jgi:hypothetical protein
LKTIVLNNSHPVALTYPDISQSMSQAIDPGIEITVGTISIIAPVNYNQSIRVIPDTSKQKFAQNHVCPCPSDSSFSNDCATTCHGFFFHQPV